MPDGDATFANRLYGQLATKPGNLFFSPASIRIALAMTYAGARGDTAADMQRALALAAGGEAHTAFATLLASWDKLAHPANENMAARAAADPEMQRYYEAELERKKIVLHVVNRLWAQRGYKFRDEFLKLLRDDYHAPLAELDFRHDAEAGRVTINKWVSDNTEHKIRELIARGLITDGTRLVLTNAVYFKAHWAEQFEKSATQEQPFFLDGKKQVRAPFMHQMHYFKLASFDGGQLLEMPYGDGDLVMDVVLPTARDGLPKVEKKLDTVLAMLPSLKSGGRVDVWLPRFKTSSSFSLSDALGAIGMARAFKYPDADFSGMDGGHELYISNVVHQAFVDVDENGTEAAAATAVLMAAGSAPPRDEPTPFRADHPFLFLIRDTRSGAILFLGRLADPSAK